MRSSVYITVDTELLAAEARAQLIAATDASAIADYFAPLRQWLDEQNRNRKCGW